MYGDQSGEFVCGYWGLNKVDKYHGWIPRKALHQLFLSFHADSLQKTFQTFYPQPHHNGFEVVFSCDGYLTSHYSGLQ